MDAIVTRAEKWRRLLQDMSGEWRCLSAPRQKVEAFVGGRALRVRRVEAFVDSLRGRRTDEQTKFVNLLMVTYTGFSDTTTLRPTLIT